MRRLLPQTLFAQTLLVLLAGIGLSLVAGAWIYSSAREEAVRAVGALAAAERIINVSRLVGEAPAAWRKRLADGASDPLFRVALEAARPAVTGDGPATETSAVIADYIKQSLPGRAVLVAVAMSAGDRWDDSLWPHGTGPRAGFGPGGSAGMGAGPGMHGAMRHGPLARASMSWRGIDAAVEIADGQWLRFTTALPDTGPTTSPRLLLALAVIAGMIALLTAWAVRRMTAPLGLLSDAAVRLGRNVDAPALDETGTEPRGGFGPHRLRGRQPHRGPHRPGGPKKRRENADAQSPEDQVGRNLVPHARKAEILRILVEQALTENPAGDASDSHPHGHDDHDEGEVMRADGHVPVPEGLHHRDLVPLAHDQA